jgi:hypothetical protein
MSEQPEKENSSEQAKVEVARQSSEIEFPYVDLEQAMEVPHGINQRLGSRGSIDQISGALNLKGGALTRRIAGARMAGLIERDGRDYRITDLGRRIISPETSVAASARVEAFLAIELYRRVYEEFKGASLPADKGFENHIRGLGVPEKVTDEARRSLKRFARQAGFFQFGEDRLIMPAIREETSEPARDESLSQPAFNAVISRPPPLAFDGNGGTAPIRLHKALVHALETLPPEGQEWMYEDLDDWLDGFKGVLRLVYKVKRPKGY